MIKESKMNILYHFTNIMSLKPILKSNSLKAGNEQSSSRNNKNYISFTRHQSSLEGFANPNACNVRIVIDANKLQQKHPNKDSKLYPYEYYSPNRGSANGESAKQVHIEKSNDKLYTAYGDNEYFNQAEESYETTDKALNNLSEYILSIDINIDFSKSSKVAADTYTSELINTLRGVKKWQNSGLVHIYEDFKDFNYRTDNYLSVEEYLSMMSDVESNGELSPEEQKKREIELAWSQFNK